MHRRTCQATRHAAIARVRAGVEIRDQAGFVVSVLEHGPLLDPRRD
jgi:hypothetical protein